MSNKKKKPAAGKSVAGKNNSGKNNVKQAAKLKEKQKAEAQKNAQRIAAQREQAQRERAQKSAEIQKRRAKENEKAQREEKKLQQKNQRQLKRENRADNAKKSIKKIKFYTSREFLGSFNYARIFLFIVLPLVVLGVGIFFFTQTVFVNVPQEIRDYSYDGVLESEAQLSKLSTHQRELLSDVLDSVGSNRFDFYIKKEILFVDGETESLCFGNPQENDCVLVAVIFNSEGDVIYRSMGLESGKELNDAKLFKELAFGNHKVKVAVNAYDKNTNEKIGTRYADITLKIEG